MTSFIGLRINSAKQLKESVIEPAPNTKIYLAFGKTDSWANDSSPPISNSSISSLYEIWDNMIGGKRVLGGDFSHVIPRYDWEANTKYVAYDHMNPNLYDGNTKFYVMTDEYNVYKCLSNNNSSNSTVKPTSINPASSTLTSDGYIWKYMYTINDSEKIRYLTDNYIPVKTLVNDEGSTQWKVQSQAIDGGVESVEILSPGTNYSNSSNIDVIITGDGSGARAIVTTNTVTNTINSIIIVDPGKNYTYSNFSIVGGAGSGAQARAIISPPGGHGKDPLYELGGTNLMLNIKLRYSEDGILPIDNDFRQISLIEDPIDSQTANVATSVVFLQALTITTIGAGNYVNDEIVYQGTSLANSIYSGRVVSWDSSTGKVYVTNSRGNPVAARTLIGNTSLTVRTVSNIEDSDLKKYSGKILFSDNITPITRATDQIEDFKIVVRF